MHFLDAKSDGALRASLIAGNVIGDGDLAAMIDTEKHESGMLFEDVIIPNASKFDAKRWLYWQVSKLGLHRLNRPHVTREFIERERFDAKKCAAFRSCQIYPIGKASNASAYVAAVGRVEHLDRAKKLLGGDTILLAAAPNEISSIFELYGQYTSIS
jgi:hypothetical protein